MKGNIYKTSRAAICLLALLNYADPLSAQDKLYQQFKTPPQQFRPVPFWHLNGALTTNEINKQVTDAAKSGFGGVAVLPVTAGPLVFSKGMAPGISPAYLTEKYFSRYGDILKSAKSSGVQVILYDDIDFPSGSAGGKLHKLYPEAERKNLVKTDTAVAGPINFNSQLPGGEVMAVVGLNTDTRERKDLTTFVKNNKLEWNVPQGNWRIMYFTMKTDGDHLVDYMDPDAVKKFVSLTYEEYARRFSSYFGSTIKQTFFDDVGYVTKERGWTSGITQKFKTRFGKDPALYYPALWEDIGPETEAARIAFYDTRAELLAEGFPKVVAEWDQQHGLKSSGHPPGNYEPQPVDMNFDVFKFYRHEHIPTMDAIFYHGHGRDGFKLISSAAAYYDRPEIASETYGAFREESFDANMLYRTAMEIFARGINFLIPHGMWYDPSAKSVRIPPLISPYSEKIAPELNRYNEFAARTSLMLQGGKTVADVAVLYPIASLEGFYHFEAKDNKDVGKYVSPGTDYLKISNMLTNNIHRDFTFIHPEFFAGGRYALINNSIVLDNKENKQSYNTLILPSGNIISYAALLKLKSFFDAGGKVIATGTLPSKSAEFGNDAAVNELVAQIFKSPDHGNNADSILVNRNTKGGISAYIPTLSGSKLQAALNLLNERPDVLLEHDPQPKSGNGAFSYLHKVKDGRNVYFFANSTDDGVNTFVDLKGRLTLQHWDPYTGQISQQVKQNFITIKGQPYTRVQLNLSSVKSIFFVEKR